MNAVLIICALLIPALMLGFGLLLYKKPPKRNWAYGYRTRAASRSDESWDFAQRYFGKLWLGLGAVLFVAAGTAAFVLTGKPEKALANGLTVIMAVQCALMLIPIIPVELALRKRFDENGKPRER